MPGDDAAKGLQIIIKPPSLCSLLLMFGTQGIASTSRKSTELRAHQAPHVFIRNTQVCYPRGDICKGCRRVLGSNSPPSRRKRTQAALLAAVPRDSGRRHSSARALHRRRVAEPRGEARGAARLSSPICRNPSQRAERSDGQMKTDTMDAVGLRNAYSACSRG